MKLCYDDVTRWGLCLRMLLHFRRNYTEPTEILEIVKDEYFTIPELHYGFQKLGAKISPEEKAAYYNRVAVDEASAPTTFLSDHITNSKLVAESSYIDNSEHINHSQEVKDSKYVERSQIIKQSEDIYFSKYITKSKTIVNSLNISDCHNILNSNYIMNSSGIVESNWVNKSANIINSSRVSDSFFCKNSTNIENCLFCSNIQNKQYYIFNQPASEWVFNFTKEQLQYYSQFELDLVQIVRTDLYPEFPILNPAVDWFKSYPNSFYDWLKTIPLYNHNLMLQLTLDERFNS